MLRINTLFQALAVIVIITLLLSIVVTRAYASTDNGLWLNWEMAMIKNRIDNKPICVKVIQEGCHYCSDMQRDVFDHPEVMNFMAKHFTLVKVNLSKDDMPLGFNVSMTPSFFFLTPEGKLIKKIPGAWKKDEFLNMISNIVKRN